jgi:hypothetical protein
MATPVVSKKASVRLTAGMGFRNENGIAARFLLDLLAGTNTLGVDFGKINRVQWQGRDLGWFADDLVIDCTTSTGKRAAGISIKSDRQVTGAGFPSDFVGIAWAQWLGVKTDRSLRGSDDAIVLMIGSLPNDVEDAWLNLLADALRTTPERMQARLAASWEAPRSIRFRAGAPTF